MATTNFVDYSTATPIRAAWLNDVDALTYDVFGGAATVAAARTALSVTDENIQDVVGAMFANSASITWTYNDASNTISGAISSSSVDHGGLTGLADDDHAQYFALSGRAGGQVAYGGTAASENLRLDGTSHATAGYVYTLASNLGAGTATPARRLHSAVADATTNAITYASRITHTTSGTPAIGIGVGAEYEVQSLGGNVIAATTAATYTTVTGGAEVSDYIISTRSGSIQEAAKINLAGVGFGMSGRTIRGPFHARSSGKHFIMEADTAISYLNYFETTSEGVVHLRGNTLSMSNSQTLVTWNQSTGTGNTAMSLPGPGSSISLNGGTSVGSGVLYAVSKDSVDSGPVDVLTVGLTRSGGAAAAGAGPRINFVCTTSAADNQEIGGALEVVSTDITAGSEDFKMVFYTQAAGGAVASRGYFGLGLVVGSPTGGDKGSNTVNASAYYDDGVLLVMNPARTWQDMTASRAFTTIYQNTTGYEIQISVVVLFGATGDCTLNVDTAATPTIVVARNNGNSWRNTFTATVPAGSYYRITATDSTLTSWAEFR